MNVTLRLRGEPDVWIGDGGHSCDLVGLEREIRALLAARRWLKHELDQRKPKAEKAK